MKSKALVRKLTSCTALIAMLGLACGTAQAAGSMAVEPLFAEVLPQQSTSLRVQNDSDKPTTVEVTVQERLIDENGVQTLRPADDDFVILPPQAVIQPGQVQVVRAQFAAPPPAESHSYYVSIRQLPVELAPNTTGGAQIQVLFAFDVALHVTPRGSKAKLAVKSASLTRITALAEVTEEAMRKPEKGTMADLQGVEVELVNSGNKYVYLQDLAFTGTGVDKSGRKIALPLWSNNEIINAAKVTLLPPGKSRKFVLPLRKVAELSSVSLDVSQLLKTQ